jgi:hypothetical protein
LYSEISVYYNLGCETWQISKAVGWIEGLAGMRGREWWIEGLARGGEEAVD